MSRKKFNFASLLCVLMIRNVIQSVFIGKSCLCEKMHCILEFTNPTKQYYPGDKMNMRLLMSLAEDKFIKSIMKNIVFNSKMHFFLLPKSTVCIVAIKGRVKINLRRGKRAVTNSENCVDLKIVVLDKRHVQAGISSFNFNTKLPVGCPGSFQGEYGCIKYEAVVLVSNTLLYDRFPFDFTVLSNEPLPFFDRNVWKSWKWFQFIFKFYISFRFHLEFICRLQQPTHSRSELSEKANVY